MVLGCGADGRGPAELPVVAERGSGSHTPQLARVEIGQIEHTE